jgi:superfamily II DNA/RNA helicase
MQDQDNGRRSGNSPKKSWGRGGSSSSGRSGSGGSSFGGSRRRFSSPSRGQRPGSDIETSRYIKKAVVKTEVEEYTPVHKFIDFNINDKLKANIIAKQYITPTPIQDRTIPSILEGRDLLGIANTGTGKTAAFLIPLIEKVFKSKNEKVLIMAPTRELALQIDEEFKAFSKHMSMDSVACIGGANIRSQMFSLSKRRPNFIIGTPGRLKDLVERRCINPAKFTNIVLDEVDRMLDMGFINDIKELLAMIPEPRQSLFFSATISKEVDNLIKGFLKDPVKVSVKLGDTAENVDQDVIKVKDRSHKIESLHDLLINEDFKKVLIFGRTKRGVEDLSVTLSQRGFKVGAIHGDKTQAKREQVLRLFKTNKIQTLVATDVAARGLDIADITHVINYDLPATYEDYVHRIGRTGRANKTGKALTFV